MATVYDAAVAALRAHWKAHDDKQPQKLALSPSHHDELTKLRRIGLAGLNVSADTLDADRFMGVPIERRDDALGVLVSVDGAAMPLDV